MIESILLDNYKQFESFKLGGLKRLNILSGQNNTGKTSILEALFMFHDRRSVSFTQKQFAWRGVHSVDLTAAALWQPLFNNFDLAKTITITLNGDGADETISYVHGNDYFAKAQILTEQRNMEAQETFSNSDTTEFLQINQPNGDASYLYINNGKLILDRRSPIAGSNTNSNTTPKKPQVVFVHASARGNSFNEVQRLGEIDIASGLEEITNYLTIIEPRLTSLSIVPHAQQPLIYGDIGLKRKIPVAYMGEGITKLLSILVAIASTLDGIVCVDEIENGIHYSLFPKVWEAIETMAKAYNCQLFITTHSHDALHGLYEYYQHSQTGEFSFTRLDRVKDAIVPKLYDSEMLLAAMDRDWELR